MTRRTKEGGSEGMKRANEERKVDKRRRKRRRRGKSQNPWLAHSHHQTANGNYVRPPRWLTTLHVVHTRTPTRGTDDKQNLDLGLSPKNVVPPPFFIGVDFSPQRTDLLPPYRPPARAPPPESQTTRHRDDIPVYSLG